jgi:hypothetical protein
MKKTREYDVAFLAIKLLMFLLDVCVLVALVQCAEYFKKHKRRKEVLENGKEDLSTRQKF